PPAPEPPPPPPPIPAPQPEPEPPPPPPTISYEEFIRQQGRPQPQQPRPTPPPRPVETPRINVEDITRNLQQMVASATDSRRIAQLSADEQRELEAYFARIRSALRRAWEKPSGVSHRLEAVVQFDVTSAGSIVNPRILSGSGTGAFDRSVLAAFGQVSSVGPPPDRRGYTLQLTFRMTD
ncbi:MAG: TonB C-terminal domain-containing protein, partial [Puniceicoccaceae bacterium]